MLYKGLYRTMFIVIIIIALIYLGIGLFTYIAWQSDPTTYNSSNLFTLLSFLRAFIPFIFALATIVVAMFALANKEFAAILAPGLLLITYASQELLTFLYFFNQFNSPYEVYFFNPLLLIALLTVIFLTSFTIYTNFHHKHH